MNRSGHSNALMSILSLLPYLQLCASPKIIAGQAYLHDPIKAYLAEAQAATFSCNRIEYHYSYFPSSTFHAFRGIGQLPFSRLTRKPSYL